MASISEKERNVDSNAISSSVYAESIRLIFDSTLSAVGAMFTAASFLVYLFIQSIPPMKLYSWVSYMFLVALLRLFTYLKYRGIDEQLRGAVWGKIAIIIAGLTGLGWGMGVILFWPLLTYDLQLILLLVVVAYTAGALTTTFPVAIALYCLLLPAILPLVWFIFAIGSKFSFSIGAMLLFYIGFVIGAAGRLRRLLAFSLKLRFENEDLVGYLKDEKEKSEQLNTSLTLEVEERKRSAEKLVAARKEAEQANQAKTRFLANMSHDIRTPMNAIIGMTAFMLDTNLSTEQRKFIENIKVSSDGLLGLLNDILDFSKIEAGQLLIVKNDFNFRKMLSNIESIMTYSAAEKGLELHFPENIDQLPEYVKGDELRLRQILVNLIGNGIKFTPRGSVTLSVAATYLQDEEIQFHFIVSDTGIGIPEEKQKEIFASFSQADSSITREFGGSGLGLTICSQLVEMMGGKIWVESEKGAGAVFNVSIPLSPGKEENIVKAELDIATKRSANILLVDDNKLNLDLAKLILENDNHTVTTAENGLQPLQYMTTDCFDMILMDVQMPTMDGLTSCMIIRGSESGKDLSGFNLPEGLAERLSKKCAGKHIPIIAMTAHAMEGDKQKCLDAGMDDYLTKPFDPVQIRQVVAQRLSEQ